PRRRTPRSATLSRGAAEGFGGAVALPLSCTAGEGGCRISDSRVRVPPQLARWLRALLTAPCGRPIGRVFKDDALGKELGPDMVGICKTALLSGFSALSDPQEDEPVRRICG